MIVCYDLETYRFGPCNLAPKPVCLSYCDGENSAVVATCESGFDDLLEHTLKQDLITTANGAYDAAVILQHRPKLAPLLFKAYREDRITDIQIREQLKNLGTTGDLKFAFLPNGAKSPLKYSQADLEKKHLGIDRSEEKDRDDSWRTNYEILDGIPASEYPPEAFAYSRDDSVNGRAIHIAQDADAHLLRAQFLHARASLALYLNSAWGFPVDSEMVEKLFAEMSERFHERHFQNLIKHGLLRPSEPPRPHTRLQKKAVEILGSAPPDWTPHVERLTALGIKFTAGEDASYNTAMLRAHVEQVSEKFDIPIVHTDTGLVSYAEEVQVELKGLDPIFDEYIARNEIQKLVTTELPRMRQGRVHPKYNILVKTSRVSSYGNSKKDKNPAYPAANIQQIDPRVREAYIADPGTVLCSIDYDFIELVSAAQKCLTLFGQSVLADRINSGYDPHAYLGAALARRLDPEFKWSRDNDENYQTFLALKKPDEKRYKHWRTFAKPTGLGFPGGLGAKRFVGYAKSTFGVDMIEMAGSMDAAVELAKALKAEWLVTYPEFEAYFRWVTRECVDLGWSDAGDPRYQYVSPFGTLRRNCYYTEATNGAALQTATAEGAKIALFKLAEAMYDPAADSCLFGACHQVAFIHDEVILQIPLDAYTHERAFEAARLWREGMSEIMTKVKVGAEPALMFRWNKAASPTFDQNKRLIPWQPTKKSA